MIEKEKFEKTFGKMHASPDILAEVMNMACENVTPIRMKRNKMKVAAAVAACILVLGTGSTVYAMDLGGIQRIVQVWIHGDQTDAILNVNDGTYTIENLKEDSYFFRQGGGIAWNEDGTERKLTEEELLEHLNEPDVRYDENGKVWVYYYDQKMEITDKFEDDVCYIQLIHDKKTIYMTIKYKDGYAMSPHGYIEP